MSEHERFVQWDMRHLRVWVTAALLCTKVVSYGTGSLVAAYEQGSSSQPDASTKIYLPAVVAGLKVDRATATPQPSPTRIPGSSPYAKCVVTETAEYTWSGATDVITTTYDVSGNARLKEADYTADGTLDRVWQYERDSRGMLLTTIRDDGGDGTADWVQRYIYDAGLLVREETDEGADGTVNEFVRNTYVAQLRTVSARDRDADGVDDEVTRYYYEDGLETRKEEDWDNDGRVDSVTLQDWRDRLLRRQSGDTFGDGTLDWIVLFTYDELEQVVLRESDSDADGDIDSIVTYAYSNEGRLSQRERYARGELEAGDYYQYDSEGRLLSVRGEGHYPYRIGYQNDCP